MTTGSEHSEVKTPPRNPYRGLRKAAIAFIIFAILWLLFGQAVPRLFFLPPPPPPPATANDTPQRIDRLEAKITALEDALANTPPGDASLTDARVAALQSKVDALQQQPAAPAEVPHDARVAQLEANVQALQQQVEQLQAKSEAQLSALAAFQDMKDTIQRGEAFGDALQQMQQLVQNNSQAQAVLNQMAPYTRSGIALEQLQALFDATVPKALAADEDSAFKRNLRALISIRRVGDAEGNSDEAIIARAENKLKRGEVRASVKELSALSPTAADGFAHWINKAKIWLYLRGKLDALQLALLDAPPAQEETAPEAPPEASPSAGGNTPTAYPSSLPLPPLPPLPAQSFPAAHNE